MSLDLGAKPADLLVRLVRGAPFITTLVSVDLNGAPSAYPAGTAISLKIDQTTFPLTVVGSEATVLIPAANVDALLAGVPDSRRLPATLFYSDGTSIGPTPWAVGHVSVR